MSAVAWLDGMSPWPSGGFGLERMRALLAALGDPQLAYPAIHVVGTNGKSTATVTIEQLLLSEGLSVGSTLSPHVVGWSERIRVNGAEADFERRSPVSAPTAEAVGATQFEIVTAAALAEFASAEVDVAVVEAGLGGRHDATNVLRTRVVLLTNVGLEHTDVLGDTLEAIAAEKLAVATPDAIVVLPDDTYAELCPAARSSTEAHARRRRHSSATRSRPRRRSRSRGGSSVVRARSGTVRTIPTVRGTSSSSSTATTHDRRLDPGRQGRRRDALASSAVPARGSSRRRSSSARALPAHELAELARRHFEHVEVVEDPVAAVARAHELGEPVLVTGLAVPARRSCTGGAACAMARLRERLAVLAFAVLIVAAIIGLAFALGYGVGKLLL